MLDAKGEDMETLAPSQPEVPDDGHLRGLQNGKLVWQEIAFFDAIVFISDVGMGSCVTCGEIVDKALKKHGPGIRIVFRDSRGRWDELCHDGGSFSGYRTTNLRPPQMTS